MYICWPACYAFTVVALTHHSAYTRLVIYYTTCMYRTGGVNSASQEAYSRTFIFYCFVYGYESKLNTPWKDVSVYVQVHLTYFFIW